MIFKRITISLFIIILSIPAYSQALTSITIEDCYHWAYENYPLIKQLDLIERSKNYQLNNASKGYLPQININGQASYQSEVTSIPIDIPNLEIPSIDKDQYKIYADIFQPLSNRSIIKSAKKAIEINSQIEKQQIDIDLYKLNDRINQIYFGILLIIGKIDQLEIIKNDLENTITKVEAALAYGTASKNNLNLLEAELIGLNQKINELKYNHKSYSSMLATLIGQEIDETTKLRKPSTQENTLVINRKELQLFNSQKEFLLLKEKQVKQKIIPTLGLFAQAGIGKPALNFFNNEFQSYYLGGIRLNWNLSQLYSSKNERKVLSLQFDKIASNKETFLLNTQLTLTQEQAEIEMYKEMIATDTDLILLREEIKHTATQQLSHGLITALDFVSYLNAENKARQERVLHEIQLLKSQYNLKITTGN